MANNFVELWKINFQELLRSNRQMYMNRPKMFGIMVNEEDGVTLNSKDVRLRYFKLPKGTDYPLDLNEGFENYRFRTSEFYERKLNKIEQFLLECDQSHQRGSDDMIYSHTSALHRIMSIPYKQRAHPRNDLTIYATKFDGNIFLVVQKDTRDELVRVTKNDTYHHKFEQYCFSDAFDKEPDTSMPVDENKQTYAIYRTLLKDFNITYSAEIDGVISDCEIKDITNCVELNKCNFARVKLLFNQDDGRSWRSHPKVLTWWLQSYLSNVNDIYFGLKDELGYVKEPIKKTRVQNLPTNQRWKPNVCVTFLYDFLKMVKVNMATVDCPYTVYEFQFNSAERRIKYKIHEGQTEYSFLTEQFISQIQRK